MTPRNFDDVALRLHESDSVAVLKRPLKAGVEVLMGAARLVLARDIPQGHKFALSAVAQGQPVRKYGQIIGFAKVDIAPGDHVHTHNVAMKDFGRDYQFCSDVRPVNYHPADQMRYFKGYARPGGQAGTRNYLAVILSVNCSASVSHYVRDRFKTAEFQRDFPNVDGVVAFTHKGGCAMPLGTPMRS